MSDDSLPDVWIVLGVCRKYPLVDSTEAGARETAEEFDEHFPEDSPHVALRYVPAARVEKYREALRAAAVDETGYCSCCNGMRWKHAPSCLLHEDSGRA
jgi:hypothetical protein